MNAKAITPDQLAKGRCECCGAPMLITSGGAVCSGSLDCGRVVEAPPLWIVRAVHDDDRAQHLPPSLRYRDANGAVRYRINGQGSYQLHSVVRLRPPYLLGGWVCARVRGRVGKFKPYKEPDK